MPSDPGAKLSPLGSFVQPNRGVKWNSGRPPPAMTKERKQWGTNILLFLKNFILKKKIPKIISMCGLGNVNNDA